MSSETPETVLNVVELPGLDDTQIWEKENETREVMLYLSTENGKIKGAEHAPFVLPQRWTYQTLEFCINDYIKNRLGFTNKQITQIYYKRCGKSRTVVAINSDQDITALLQEYPMKTQNGRSRGKRAVMVMAVDLVDNSPSKTPGKENTLLQLIGLDETPRRSPRLLDKKKQAHSSASTKVTTAPCRTPCMDVFLFEVKKSNSGDPKMSKTATVLHDVPVESTLSKLKKVVRAHESNSVVYVPVNGFYWIRKGSKQMVQLQTEADLNYCKAEYTDSKKSSLSSIRIACSTVNYEDTTATKRSLFEDADAAELQLIEQSSNSSKAKKTTNDLWNDSHCDLVRELEKKGTVSRYSTRHLKVWTDHIVEGKSVGAADEPKWESLIDLVGVPPRQGREKKSKSSDTSSDTSTDDLLKTMLIQNQRNTEVFQTSLLAILANQQSRMQSPVLFSPHPQMCSTPAQAQPSPPPPLTNPYVYQPEVKERKKLTSFTCKDCIEFLEANELTSFIPQFVEIEVDGPLLASLCHPSLGYSILEGMGINKFDGVVIVNAVKKEMSRNN